MRSLAGSLADGVLADAILILLYPPIPPTYIERVWGCRKNMEKKKKRGDVEMAKCYSFRNCTLDEIARWTK